MIIWGLRQRGKVLGQRMLTCPNCHREAMTGIAQNRRWFTLFFIPIFPISARKTTAVCGLCGFRYEMDTKYADSLFPAGTKAVPAPQAPPTTI